jgi:hypothetical protein
MAVQYTIKKNITKTVWKWVEGVEKVFRIEAPIRIGRAPKPGSAIEKPAELIDVIDLETGNKEVLIAGKVIRDNLIETYSDDAYVGRYFRAVQGPMRTGRKYKDYVLEEIEWTGEIPTPTPSTSAPATPTPPTKPARGKK